MSPLSKDKTKLQFCCKQNICCGGSVYDNICLWLLNFIFVELNVSQK